MSRTQIRSSQSPACFHRGSVSRPFNNGIHYNHYNTYRQIEATMKGLNRAIIATSMLGVIVSTYALYVEMATEAHKEYKPFCDLADRVSCSRVLTSEYAKGFGLIDEKSMFAIPNCIYGILFYCLMAILATFDNLTLVRLQFFTAVLSIASCVYLAYLLIFILHDLCIVCVSTYVVNSFITVFVYKKMLIVVKKAC